MGDMAVSNAVGSNVFDILICLGLPWFLSTAIVYPGSSVSVYSKGERSRSLKWNDFVLLRPLLYTRFDSTALISPLFYRFNLLNFVITLNCSIPPGGNPLQWLEIRQKVWVSPHGMVHPLHGICKHVRTQCVWKSQSARMQKRLLMSESHYALEV